MPWGGPYVQTSWVSGTTPLSQPNMNNLETQYNLATNTFEQDLWTPFVLTGLVASKDLSIANQLDVTTGVAFLLQTDSTVARQSIASSSGPLTTSAHTATYYLDLNPNGTYSFATTHSGTPNYLTIAQVTTDSSGNISVVTDKRNLNTSLFVNAPSTNGVGIPGALFLGAAETGSQSEIFYTHANAAVAYNSPQAGAGPWGHAFGTWNGSALVVPFSIGGQFISALGWVDNSGNIVTGGYLSMGTTEGGSRSQLFYSHANLAATLNTPQGGGSALGISFGTWTGAAQAVPWSIGGQFNNAASWVDNTGALTLGAAVAKINAQATAGSYGVPLIVAQSLDTHVTGTGSQLLIDFTPTANGYYRFSIFMSIGGSSNTISAKYSFTDQTLGVGTFIFETNDTNPPTALNAFSYGAVTTFNAASTAVWATTGSHLQITYQNSTGTPNDFVTAMIERLG